jgi:hypothetical protein
MVVEVVVVVVEAIRFRRVRMSVPSLAVRSGAS